MRTAWTKTPYRLLAQIILLFALTGPLAGAPGLAEADARLVTPSANAHLADISLTSLQPLLIARTCAGCGHYVVTPGDTLFDIADRFGVAGGWPQLYAANRRLIGRDPDLIRVGLILRMPAPRAAPKPQRVSKPTPAPAAVTPSLFVATPLSTQARTAGTAADVAPWPVLMFLAVALVIAGFRKEPVLPVHRGWWLALTRRALTRGAGRGIGGANRTASKAASGLPPLPQVPAAARLVFVDHKRVLVTRLSNPLTVVVFRPPGQHPEAILRVARLVLPMPEYVMLADRFERSGFRRPGGVPEADRLPLLDDMPR